MFSKITSQWLALLLVVATSVTWAAPLPARTQVVVRTIAGNEQHGTLNRVDSSGIKLEQTGNVVSIPTSEVLSLRLVAEEPADTNQYAFLGLVDGSRIPIENVTVEKRRAAIESPLLGAITHIPASQIAWIELRPLAAEARAYLQYVLAENPTDDLVVVQKGDPPQFDHLSGLLGDITSEAINFVWDDEDISVKRSKLAAVAFYHRSEALPAALCVAKTRSGAELMLASIEYHHGSRNIEVTLVGGNQIAVPVDDFLSADFSAGKIFYLSNLEPIRQQWTPLVGIPISAESLEQFGLPRRNQSFTGSSITLAWPEDADRSQEELRTYDRGLALRSRTTVEYRIPSGIASFQTFAGIDPQTRDQGNVRLEIKADKKKLWEGEIDGRQSPVEISLSLSKARRLKIVVDYGKNLDYGDRLHLADARLIKE